MSKILECRCTGCKYPFWVSVYEERPILYCPFCGGDTRRLAEEQRKKDFEASDFHQWAIRKTRRKNDIWAR